MSDAASGSSDAAGASSGSGDAATAEGDAGSADAGTGAAPIGVCAGEKAPNPDVATTCNAIHAEAGATCTEDCCIPCGIGAFGSEMCPCKSGLFSACSCPVPKGWLALSGICGDSECLTMGGPCSPQGYSSDAGAPAKAAILDGTSCVMNGNVCFTAEADGKHGCVCASDPSGDFTMKCGLVNGWFSNTHVPTTY